MFETNYLYPKFERVLIDYKKVFETCLNKYDSYSDFNLLSMLSWDSQGVNSFSILNGNLVVRIKDYLSEGFVYSILGNEKMDESITSLLKEVKTLTFVPEISVNSISDKSMFIIEEDRDNWDYILSTEKIISLVGRCYKHLREDVHKFQKIYPKYEFKILALTKKEDLDSILNLTEKWFCDKNFNQEKKTEELEILNSFIKNSSDFNCIATGLFVDNNLISYTFNEIITTQLFMSHFGGSDNAYILGAYMLEYETAKYFNEKGFLYQNHQQDAGLQGLRAAKMFYNPIGFLKKYIIKAKD
jgi:uncharacterized protein